MRCKGLTIVVTGGAGFIGGGGTYNVSGRNERTNFHMVESICDLIDKISPSAPRRDLTGLFPTARAMIVATRLAPQSSKSTSAGAPRRISKLASARPSIGTSINSHGGGRS